MRTPISLEEVIPRHSLELASISSAKSNLQIKLSITAVSNLPRYRLSISEIVEPDTRASKPHMARGTFATKVQSGASAGVTSV